MVKAVQAEDAISDHFDRLLKDRVTAEVCLGVRGRVVVEKAGASGMTYVGLLIGKPSVGSRDIVLAVVPHPDGEEVLEVVSAAASTAAAAKPKKGGASKGASSGAAAVSISIRQDDVADHALQVFRMLPGGLAVLGLYLFAPDSGFASASSGLCKALCSIAADLGALSASSSSSAGEQQELLLLHVDSATKKFSMKSCLASNGDTAAAASLKPCELKFGPSLASLVCLRASHTFDFTLAAASASAQLQQLLQEAVTQESARVLSGLAVVSGALPANTTQPLADLLPASSSGVTGGGNSISDPVQVQLYCSPPAAAAANSTAAWGSCRLHGTVEAVAYVHRRDAAAKALSELKQDVTRSLTARLQLLQNEVAGAAYEAKQAAQADAGAQPGKAAAAAAAAPAHPLLAEAGAAGKVSRGLLRRVLMPWEGLGGIQVCDYLMEGDTAEAAVEQGRLLLGLSSLQASQVIAVESPATLQQPVKHAAAAAAGGAAGGCGNAVMAAAAAGVAAAVGVALAYSNLGH